MSSDDLTALVHLLAVPLAIAGGALLGIGLERHIKAPLRDKRGRFKAKAEVRCIHEIK
jgi:hypothetical protein